MENCRKIEEKLGFDKIKASLTERCCTEYAKGRVMEETVSTDPAEIKANLVAQLTASVRWTQTVQNMIADGADDFTECGPGAVLQGLIKKIDKNANAHGIL